MQTSGERLAPRRQRVGNLACGAILSGPVTFPRPWPGEDQATRSRETTEMTQAVGSDAGPIKCDIYEYR